MAPGPGPRWSPAGLISTSWFGIRCWGPIWPASSSVPVSIWTVTLFGQEHVERYRATDGAEGHEWEGTQTLLLTTTGRRSGEQRTTPLIYAPAGDSFTVVAS